MPGVVLGAVLTAAAVRSAEIPVAEIGGGCSSPPDAAGAGTRAPAATAARPMAGTAMRTAPGDAPDCALFGVAGDATGVGERAGRVLTVPARARGGAGSRLTARAGARCGAAAGRGADRRTDGWAAERGEDARDAAARPDEVRGADGVREAVVRELVARDGAARGAAVRDDAREVPDREVVAAREVVAVREVDTRAPPRVAPGRAVERVAVFFDEAGAALARDDGDGRAVTARPAPRAGADRGRAAPAAGGLAAAARVVAGRARAAAPFTALGAEARPAGARDADDRGAVARAAAAPRAGERELGAAAVREREAVALGGAGRRAGAAALLEAGLGLAATARGACRFEAFAPFAGFFATGFLTTGFLAALVLVAIRPPLRPGPWGCRPVPAGTRPPPPQSINGPASWQLDGWAGVRAASGIIPEAGAPPRGARGAAPPPARPVRGPDRRERRATRRCRGGRAAEAR